MQGTVVGLAMVYNTLAHMFLQRACNAKRHRAESTLERVSGHTARPARSCSANAPAVRLHVPGELAALGTAVGAQLTLVRLLAGVRAAVDGQVGAVLEHFPTKFACVVAAVARNDLFARSGVKNSI